VYRAKTSADAVRTIASMLLPRRPYHPTTLRPGSDQIAPLGWQEQPSRVLSMIVAAANGSGAMPHRKPT
jgi:hypothetical protein